MSTRPQRYYLRGSSPVSDDVSWLMRLPQVHETHPSDAFAPTRRLLSLALSPQKI